MSIFDSEVTAEQAESAVKHYTPGPQEGIEEQAETVDKTPISTEQRESLDRASQDTFQPVFGNDNQHSPVGQQVTTFIPPGEWVSPVIRDRQRLKALLPNFASINDLDARISAVMKYDGVPKTVSDLATKARVAVGQAREARNAASHPENPRYTRSVEAKDAVVKAIAEATTMVGALEREAEKCKDEWFANLTGGLDKDREAALKALKAAEKAYSTFRAKVNGAQALALETGRWDKGYHQSPTMERTLNEPIQAMRDAIRFVESEDDFESGRFLTTEYEGIPGHTLAKLQHSADVSQPGSFAQQIFMRAKSPMKHDRDLQDALQSKRLIPFLNSNPLSAALAGEGSPLASEQRAWEDHANFVDEGRQQ